MVWDLRRSGLVLGCLALTSAAAAEAAYTLRVEKERVSLSAQGAPVVRVLEDLGRQAGFEIVADIGEDVVFDAEFEGLTLGETVKRVCGSVGYLLVQDPATGRIRRVVLTPSRARASRTMPRQANAPGWRPPPPPEEPPQVVVPDIIQQQEQTEQEEPPDGTDADPNAQRRDDSSDDD